MSEQAELLDQMLAQAEICVKELHPRIGTVVSDENRNLVELERMIFVAVLRLGASWLGMAHICGTPGRDGGNEAALRVWRGDAVGVRASEDRA